MGHDVPKDSKCDANRVFACRLDTELLLTIDPLRLRREAGLPPGIELRGELPRWMLCKVENMTTSMYKEEGSSV